jgi:hypothetical protein
MVPKENRHVTFNEQAALGAIDLITTDRDQMVKWLSNVGWV